MTVATQLYRSTDLNAPPLSGQANSLNQVLGVLVNGYGFSGVSITGITRSSNTATATVSAADGLRLKTGMILTISGAVQTDYNITATITVASTTTFTYTVANTPTTPATGTILLSSLLPVTSITRSGSTVTVTIANADATLVTGHWVTIAGSGSGDYDGTFQITVTDSTHFTYQIVGTPTSPATGTITYKRAAPGGGWTIPFTGTNAAVYRPPAGTRFYLQVIDNGATAGGAKEAQAMGFETMSAYNTGTQQTPTVAQAANGLCWRKSTTADSTVRAWSLWADDRTMYLFLNDAGSTATTNPTYFGDFTSYKSGDAYPCAIAGSTSFNTASPASGLMLGGTLAATTGTNGFYIFRAYTQSGSAINGWLVAPQNTAVVHGTTGGIAYPNGADSGYYCDVLTVMEPTNTQSIRGIMRGMFAPIHNAPLAQYDPVTSIVNLSGVTLNTMLSHSSGTAGQVAFDAFGPW